MPAPVPAGTDRRIDKLLALLIEHALVVCSGAKIAREIGVSRSAVWRWVETLRGLGVKIKGHPRSGYQLQTIPDILVPQLLRRRLEGSSFAKRIHHFFKIGSTNDVALALAAAGEPHGTLVIAEQQTAGRGRLGRRWYSEKGSGIYATLLLRPAPPTPRPAGQSPANGGAPGLSRAAGAGPTLHPRQAPLLTLVAGLATREAVVELTRLSVDVRYPNDLLVNGRKFSGILTEMQAELDRILYVVVGIGVDVNHTALPADLKDIATSLRLAGGRSYSRIEILAQLLIWFERYYNRLMQEGPAPILARMAEVSSYVRDKRVRVETGRESFTATTAGLDDSGLLLLRRDDGSLSPHLAGDLTEA
ncbi:MAG: biotin--[acetyl-CoA-carboxylase] ligase [Terriglobia bacterium]